MNMNIYYQKKVIMLRTVGLWAFTRHSIRLHVDASKKFAGKKAACKAREKPPARQERGAGGVPPPLN